ncbi:MAG: glycosyltransferase family 4 protein [Anaerolineales bacterium]
MISKGKILFIDHAKAVGGAEKNLLVLCKDLKIRNWQPYIICQEGELADRAQSLKLPIYEIVIPRLRGSLKFLFNWIFGIRNIILLIRMINPNLIYSNTIRSTIYASLAARLANVKFIWHMQDHWLMENRPRWVWADNLGKSLLSVFSSRIIANSYTTANHLPKSSKVIVIHNGIDVSSFVPSLDCGYFYQKFIISNNTPIVGMMGRLRPWKGQDRFIRIASRIVKQHPETKFLIVGGDIFGVKDQYQEYLKNLVLELNLSDRVFFTGHLEDVRPAFAAMDVFVHPGDPEPFGLVNIEAMAMEKPVVAFAHGALPEIVENGKTGLLVTPYDDEELAEAVISLLKNPTLREKMGSNGRVRVQKYFNVQRMVSEIEEVFIQTIGE